MKAWFYSLFGTACMVLALYLALDPDPFAVTFGWLFAMFSFVFLGYGLLLFKSKL